MNKVYEQVKEFKNKYPGTVCWRLKAHSKVIDKYLNPGEEIKYIFAAQKSYSPFDIFSTYIVALTNKRILMAQKRVLFGHLYLSITPDMFNDLSIKSGIIWGTVFIDTVKEVVTLSNISKKALDEIETNISEYMMDEKKKYVKENKDSSK